MCRLLKHSIADERRTVFIAKCTDGPIRQSTGLLIMHLCMSYFGLWLFQYQCARPVRGCASVVFQEGAVERDEDETLRIAVLMLSECGMCLHNSSYTHFQTDLVR